jgi:hypothetical protein
VALTDAAGLVHQFHFRTRLFGGGVAMDAFELRDGQQRVMSSRLNGFGIEMLEELRIIYQSR